ncbi:hypothetical protein [Parenemella sanctibonifatiensis]|uniref:Lipoprotein n=1 Tax=Parenemella sanctibonifatiensis TaxID=2016505 RepID=A0A255ECX3_9ACTN|nr:hypothetical protein [Parenemella sanctibonifatiensis]OYN89408.1 hypothetical protein CGZ91_10960 [Parenemella sanctibonifatiensis]OYN91544.1 hypothetical protein CGZ92_00420 [Parenemella sanctibonifatiensis]
MKPVRTLVAVGSVVAVLALTGCGLIPSASNPSADWCNTEDISGSLELYTGSVPPPHNWTRTVTLEGARAKVVMEPGYVDGAPTWSSDRQVSPRDVAELCRVVVANKLSAEDENAAGGSQILVKLVADGHELDFRAYGNEETRAALRQVVGEDEWDQQQAAYEEWKASYE